MDRIDQVRKVQEELLDTFKRKNADYGDAFADYGPVGVLVRLGDKVRRMSQISSRGVTLVDDEKLRDTLMDMANYAAMAVVLLDEGDGLSLPSIFNPSEKDDTAGDETLTCYDRLLLEREEKLTEDFVNFPIYDRD